MYLKCLKLSEYCVFDFVFFSKEIGIEKVIKSDLDNIKIDGEGIELSKYLEFFDYFINVVCFICNKYSKDNEYL